jgi:hypothetical protein
MVHRFVLVKLNDAYANDAGRAEVVASAISNLSDLPGVEGVRAGPPADEAAAGSWDVAIVIELDDIDIYPAYAKAPAHLAWLENFLNPRAACKKAWNFSLSEG